MCYLIDTMKSVAKMHKPASFLNQTYLFYKDMFEDVYKKKKNTRENFNERRFCEKLKRFTLTC